MVLQDLLRNLAQAVSGKEKAKAYKALERVGMDRMTADLLVKELVKEEEKKKKK